MPNELKKVTKSSFTLLCDCGTQSIVKFDNLEEGDVSVNWRCPECKHVKQFPKNVPGLVAPLIAAYKAWKE